MKPDLTINLFHWHTQNDSLEQTLKAWSNLKAFSKYCNHQGVRVHLNLFEDAPPHLTNLLPSAIKITLPFKGWFQAAKLNQAINHIETYQPSPEFISCTDNNIQIHTKDFPLLAAHLKVLHHNQFYIGNPSRENLISLDDFSIIPYWALKKAEGFDERIHSHRMQKAIMSAKLCHLGLTKAYLPLSTTTENARKELTSNYLETRSIKVLHNLHYHIQSKGILYDIPSKVIYETFKAIDPKTPNITKQIKEQVKNLLKENTKEKAIQAVTQSILKYYSGITNELSMLCKTLNFHEAKPLFVYRLITQVPLHQAICHIISIQKEIQFSAHKLNAILAGGYGNVEETIAEVNAFLLTLVSHDVLSKLESTYTLTPIPIEKNCIPYLFKEHHRFLQYPERLSLNTFINNFATPFFQLPNEQTIINSIHQAGWKVHRHSQQIDISPHTQNQ